MQPVVRRNVLRSVLTALLLLCSREIRAEANGVKHRIDATVSIGPDSSLLRKSAGARGILTFTARISANSRESRYFGTVSPIFADILLPEQAEQLVAAKTIWEETTCHQRRGMPKVTVTFAHGSFRTDKERIEISSAVRHIGLRVPSDELTPGIKLPAGIDQVGAFYAVRAQTKDSRLIIDLKIYAFECRF